MEHIDLNELLNSAIYFGASLVLIFLGRVVYKLFHPKLNTRAELLEKDNFAFSISYVGYFIGLLLAIGSALLGGENDLLEDNLLAILVYGLGAIFLLNLSQIINEFIVFNKFKVKKEILEDQNAGTGIIEAASYIATGLIIMGASKRPEENPMTEILMMKKSSMEEILMMKESLMEESLMEKIFMMKESLIEEILIMKESLMEESLIILAFWGIAQIALILSSFLYNLITPYNIHAEIEKDNVAVSLGYAGSFVAISIVLSHAISLSHDLSPEAVLTVAVLFIIALIALPITRLITDKLILAGYDLKTELVEQTRPNIGCGLIEAMAYISTALLITWCF